ncbi:hypothetical protein EJB05_43555, partial [Eragrostis curvula]
MAGVSVCVTGASGKTVNKEETYRLNNEQSDKKTGHLKRLEKAAENLRLFNADLLDYDAMAAATAGCQGVFHVATPVPSDDLTDPEASYYLQMLGPAVTGTTNVLKAATAANVRRVVVVSSIVAVEVNPKDWPEGKIRDENCWSDREFCRNIKSWYPVAKIISEEAAIQYGRQTGLDVVTVNPGLVFGPLLQPTTIALCTVHLIRASCVLFGTDTGGPDQVRDKLWHIVDVRDVADALLLVYESPQASGRHICAPHVISVRELLDLLKSKYPAYRCISKEAIYDMDHPAPMTSEKLKKLGWSCRTLEETIEDTVQFCRDAKFLEDANGAPPCRFPPLFNMI